jgi:hypothetical protein
MKKNKMFLPPIVDEEAEEPVAVLAEPVVVHPEEVVVGLEEHHVVRNVINLCIVSITKGFAFSALRSTDLYSLIGMDLSDFMDLVSLANIRGYKRRRGPESEFTLLQKLLLCLFWLRNGFTYRFLAWLFEIGSIDTVKNYVDQTKQLLQDQNA